MPTAVVFGCTGFVGSHITHCLLKNKYIVRGACRNPSKAEWLFTNVADSSSADNLSLHSLSFKETLIEDDSIDQLLQDADAAFFCVGYEKQEPGTIDFMVNSALSVVQAAKRVSLKSGKKVCVVLTSSTGSTNPPDAAPDALKDEITFWSDPQLQIEKGKFSPAAKTLMEQRCLEFVGRSPANEIVDADKAKDSPRLCIMNPSLILGPQLQPGPISGNGLPFFARIIRGEAMAESIPNDSMSVIHVGDLAKLHVAAAESAGACGRYFGVNQSWSWEDIFTAIKKEYVTYKIPPKKYTEPKPVTRFNTSRRESLGVTLRSLDDIFASTLNFLKERREI